MFADSSETRLLVLGRDPDTDLLSLLRAWYPGASFVLERGDSLLICGHNGVPDSTP